MFGKQQCDVLVVGAGPSGLLTALGLAQRNVKVRIIDQHWRTGAHSYGLALHPRSLELLEPYGILPELIEHGRKINAINFWEGSEKVGTVSFEDLGVGFPFALVLPQSVVEGELESALKRLKVKVQWNHRLEGLEQSADQCVSEVSHLDRVATGYPIAGSEWEVTKTLSIRSKFVVGADGYHSRVREELDCEYEQVGPLQTFSVFEFETNTDPGHEVNIVFHGDLVSACWPMSERRCRWSFQIASQSDHDNSREGLNKFIQTRAPWFAPVRGEVLWASMVQFDRRLATGIGSGRLWLAGDSAHMTAPVGVQSMNAGLVDGQEISWRLAELLAGERGQDVLESYSSERLAELRALIRPDGSSAPEGGPDWVDRRWPAIASSIPATGEHLARLAGRLGSGN